MRDQPQRKDIVERRADWKKLRWSIREFTMWCRENRNEPIRKKAAELEMRLRGHYNCFGLIGNHQSLIQYFKAVMKIWFRWLNRRSQRRSYS